MTYGELKAVFEESAKTGRPLQIKNTHHDWLPMKDYHVITETIKLRVTPPEPAKPREWWLHCMSKPLPAGEHKTIDDNCKNDGWIRVREVMEDSK